MKRLTVDGVNYDTVGEASVTQVQTSGTKIATVTIDGTATDLYAPEGDPVTMEDTAVDAAVNAAFTYFVTNVNPELVSVQESAMFNEDVIVTKNSSDIILVSVGTTSGSSNVDTFTLSSTSSQSFTMPDSPVYVAAQISSSGGGSND